MKKIVVFFFILIALIMLAISQEPTAENTIKTEIFIDGNPLYNVTHVSSCHGEVELDVIIVSKLNGTCEVCINPMNATVSPSCTKKKVITDKNVFKFALFPEQNTTRLVIGYQVSCEFTNHLQMISISEDGLVVIKIAENSSYSG
ncbi:hypothetical protein [Thermococcus sp.]|uniref:hypothetical protein n=1 Tax=Thermococcus sp. TaxID=35749 RepID=UPI002605A0BF|nr:hypothetical protein [Thermococcus sp.]